MFTVSTNEDGSRIIRATTIFDFEEAVSAAMGGNSAAWGGETRRRAVRDQAALNLRDLCYDANLNPYRDDISSVIPDTDEGWYEILRIAEIAVDQEALLRSEE